MPYLWGKLNCNWKDGRCSKTYYCKLCHKTVSISSGLYGDGLCGSCAKKNYRVSPKTKIKISKATKGKNNPNYKDGITLQTKCLCGKRKDYRAKYCSKWGHKGNRNSMFGVPSSPKSSYGKKLIYKKTQFRSSYEYLYARFLTLNHIYWRYEPKAFDLDNTTYTPDFYLPKQNLYIEVKGYWRPEAKKKYKKFKQLYSKLKIEVINKFFINNISGGY